MDRPFRQPTQDLNSSLMLTKRLKHPNRPFTTKENVDRWNVAPAAIPTEGYEHAYARWRERVEALPGAPILATFAVDGRLAVGIGGANVLQNSLAMNHLWGMPVIPGSALKGLARHYAASMPDPTPPAPGEPADESLWPRQRDALFGTIDDAGYLTWHDAWWVPELDQSPYELDVVTPHHGKYYREPGNNPPWDFDDPIPSNFLTVRGHFLVAIGAPDEAWARAAMNLLRRALAEWGIGAKTSAGYGRMTFAGYVSPWAREVEEREQVEIEALQAREADARAQAEQADAADRRYHALLNEIAAGTGQDPNQPHRWYEEWNAIGDPARKHEAGLRIVQSWRDHGQYNRLVIGKPNATKGKDKPKAYAQELVAWIEAYRPDGSET